MGPRSPLTAGVLLGAFAMGSLSAATAYATCASISGVNSGGGCTTTDAGDIAIGLGPNTTATANGGFDTAIAIGADASAIADFGTHNTAIAIGNPGPNTAAFMGQVVPTSAQAGFAPSVTTGGPSSNNTALALGDGSVAQATFGSGSFATAVGNGAVALANFGDNNNAIAIGINSGASAAHGDNNVAQVVGVGSTAFAVQGNNNVARVVGDNSEAIASGNLVTLAPNNNNVATVFGNGSTAMAQFGDFNTARVFGNNSTASALNANNLTVTAIGNNVHKP
jgi:hypothetical protein